MQHQWYRDVVGGRESWQESAPTFHFCVIDDPLNSPQGIKENDVSMIKVSYGADRTAEDMQS